MASNEIDFTTIQGISPEFMKKFAASVRHIYQQSAKGSSRSLATRRFTKHSSLNPQPSMAISEVDCFKNYILLRLSNGVILCLDTNRDENRKMFL